MDKVNDNLDTIHRVQNNDDSGIKTQNMASGHSGHSSFINKLIIKNIINVSPKDIRNNTYIENNRTFTMSTVSKPSGETTDPRFSSQSFRAAVRTVLEYFGYEKPCFKDFREVESKFIVDGKPRIDWIEFAKRIEHPRFEAVCFVLDQQKNRCAKIGVTLFGATKDEALKTLDKCYEFIDWFEFPKKVQKNSSQDSITEDIEAEAIAK